MSAPAKDRRDPTTAEAAAEPAGWRLAAAAFGLSLAAVSAPIAVTAMAATNMLLGPPLAASALVGLLILAPAGVGLATALAGLQRVARLAAQAGSEAEMAVLRVLVVTVLFGYTLTAAAANGGAAADCVPVVAAALVAAWAFLLYLILWPTAPPLRRYAAMALDVGLFSILLHSGGSAVAGWYPLYIVLIFYIGSRFGPGALIAATAASVLGFAAVILTTETWRLQPALATGLLVALAALPACFAATIRALTAARQKADAAEADRQTTLRLIADTLRDPPATPRSPTSPIGDILDFAALEAGTFAPPVETFELRALVKHSLVPLQRRALDQGMSLRWRVDSRVPARLRGRALAVARILSGLAEHAIAPTRGAAVRIAIESGAVEAGHVQLLIRVGGLAAAHNPGLAEGEVPLALQLVERLVAVAGGTLAVEHAAAGGQVRLTVGLPLAVERSTQGAMLDLGRRVVLLATEDDELARALAEPLAMWNAEPVWPGDIDAALGELSRLPAAQRAVVIVDGRAKQLSALSLALRASRLGEGAPFVVLIAEEAQIGSLGEIDEDGLDGLISTPVTEELLANALEALPLAAARPPTPPEPAPVAAAPEILAPAPAPEETAHPAQVTPIAAHPRFAADGAAALDPRVIDGLRALGGGPGFAGEVIGAFRDEAQRIMAGVDEAAAVGDAARFGRGLVALRRAAGHVGGIRLCELAASLQDLTASELRQHGAEHVELLDAEIGRLAATLAEALPAAEARRR